MTLKTQWRKEEAPALPTHLVLPPSRVPPLTQALYLLLLLTESRPSSCFVFVIIDTGPEAALWVKGQVDRQ